MAPGNRLVETFFNHDTQRFFSPAKWFWGPGALDQCCRLLPEFKGALLVHDQALGQHPGLAAVRGARTWTAQRAAGGFCATESARELVADIAAAETVVAVGGGSIMDLVKGAVAEHLFGDLDGVGMGTHRGTAPLPGRSRPTLVCLPTTCGAGAEASRYYVTYQGATRRKVHGKSWHLVADWIFGDPCFLIDAPKTLLVETAFDAFVHFWESYFCRHEGGWLSRGLALHGMESVLSALPGALSGDPQCAARLSYAGTLGGIAISNVRTGHIHEAAGPLMEATGLSHGATLWVFFPAAARTYGEVVRGEAMLTNLIATTIGQRDASIDGLVAWWAEQFSAAGLLARITAAVAASDGEELRRKIDERVSNDQVWCAKESPVLLDAAAIRRFIDTSLDALR